MKTLRLLLPILVLIAFGLTGIAPAQETPFPDVEISVSAEIPNFIRQECYAALREHGDELKARLWPYVMPPARIQVHLVTTKEFRNSMQGVPDWGVGVAWNNEIYIDCQRSPGGGRSITHVLLHELSHCLIQQGTHYKTDIPRWFHEGVAQRVSGEWKFRDTISLVLSGRLPNLNRLSDRFPSNAGWADQAYRTSLLAVMSLERRFGEDVIPRLIRESSYRSFDQAFLAVTGETPTTFAKTFSSTTNLKYGWPVMLTRWPLMFVWLAVLFSIGAVIKLIRARRRYNEMDLERSGDVLGVASCNDSGEERQ